MSMSARAALAAAGLAGGRIAGINMAGRLTEPFAPGADTLVLELLPTADPAVAEVPLYTFTEHYARYEHNPSPTYLVVALRDVQRDLRLTIDYGPAGDLGAPPPAAIPAPPMPLPVLPGSVDLVVPAGAPAGASFVVPSLPRDQPGLPGVAQIRLIRLSVNPAAPNTAGDWLVVVLLGNTARLLWVLGQERDQLRQQLRLVVAQRRLAKATGRALDYLGSDLGVPRFPPVPYSFDAATVALYHLDDQPLVPQPEVDSVEDITSRHAPPGNPGTNVGRLAHSGAPGRFGGAFAFRDPGAEIRVPGLAGFASLASDSFTVECFARPDAGAADGHLVAKHADPANPALAGWALSIGAFGRGLSANARLYLSDGASAVVLFVDRTVSSAAYHHLAGVVDRAAGQARLYLDGALVASGPLGGLGALANAEPVRVGRAGTAAYTGLVDEVRISNTSRTSFHPVTGEDDETYRRRLGIFRRWTLPTRARLEDVLNEVVGPVGAESQPIVVDDADSELVAGELALAVVPNELKPGESIGADGDRRASEADVCGTAAAETSFDPLFLRTTTDPRLSFAAAPARLLTKGEAAPDPHRLQLATLSRLLALLDQLGAQLGLRVESGFDPRALAGGGPPAEDLRAVGRALLLTHATLSLGKLAARASRAGFEFVRYRADLGAVYAASARADYLEIVTRHGGTANPENGRDLFPGETIVLGVEPGLSADTTYRWTTIATGAGRASFAVSAGGATVPRSTASGRNVSLVAELPGALVVKVEARRNRRTATGSRVVLVGLGGTVTLADGMSIAADGTLGVSELVAGAPEPGDFFHPAYLVTHDSPRADYGNDLNRRRMQPRTAACLDRLLGFLAASPGNLVVRSAFVPGAPDLTGLGRGLTLEHPTVAADRLGALANDAGFSFVRRQGNQIVCRMGSAGGLATISGPASLIEAADAPLAVSPRAEPSGLAIRAGAAFTANAGTDTLTEIDPATGRVRRAVKVGWEPVAVALSPDGTRVYTADARSNTITAVDVATGVVLASISVGLGPVALVHHPTQARLYVACRDDNSLRAIDTAALAPAGTLVLGARPVGLACRPDGTELWVTLDAASQLAFVALPGFTLAATIALPTQPAGVAFRPDGAVAYVALPAAGRLAVVNVGTRAVSVSPVVGAAPTAVACAPDGSAVYASDVGAPGGGSTPDSRLLVLNPDGSARTSVRVPAGSVAVAALGALAYVACRLGNSVSVVDVAEGGLADNWPLGSGLGERLGWVLRLGKAARARLSTTTAPEVVLHADAAGPVLARAVYTLPGGNDPYTFAVRLKPALEADPTVVLRKDQYDLMMNVLNALHPVGVEVVTRAIRERVVEVREGLLAAFPDYTYPNYRVRGPALRRPVQ